MKKHIFLLIIAAAALCSCQNALKVETPSKFNADIVFDTEENAGRAMWGAYTNMGNSEYPQIEYIWYQNTDVECNTPKEKPDGTRNDIFALQGGLLENFNAIYQCWNNIYKTIDRCNLVIENLEGKEGAGFKAILGEAYTLRAFKYLQACCFWGDIPYCTYSASFDRELDLPKTDKNVIFSGELQKLADHQADMFWADKTDGGIERMNREFCLGLIAKIALFRAGYGMTYDGKMKRADEYLDPTSRKDLQVTYTIDGVTKTAVTSKDYFRMADDYCRLLIKEKDRPLIADYSEVFMNENKYVAPVNSEVLYEVPHADGSGGVGYSIGAAYSDGRQGASGVQVKLCPAYLFSFDEADTRMQLVGLCKWVSDIALPADVLALCTNKWNRKDAGKELGKESKSGTGINFPVMRYSDVLLMLAEAENEINDGPTDLACEMLARVRKRAFKAEDWAEKVDDYISFLSDKDEFFNAIVDERAWEFGGESLRKFDLVRWNIYGKKINAAKDLMTKIGRASYAALVELEPELQPYTVFSDYAYVTKADNKLIWYNTIYRVSPAPKATITSSSALYKTENWNGEYFKFKTGIALISYNKTDPAASTPAAMIDRIYRGYTDPTGESAVPYLIPISTTTISTSKHLNNDGYGHVR